MTLRALAPKSVPPIPLEEQVELSINGKTIPLPYDQYHITYLDVEYDVHTIEAQVKELS